MSMTENLDLRVATAQACGWTAIHRDPMGGPTLYGTRIYLLAPVPVLGPCALETYGVLPRYEMGESLDDVIGLLGPVAWTRVCGWWAWLKSDMTYNARGKTRAEALCRLLCSLRGTGGDPYATD